MKPFRAFGLRLGHSFSSERVEREGVDLSTFTGRALMRLPADAVMVAPPAALWTPLAGLVAGRSLEGTLPGDPWARFILRMPSKWNGRLAVSGSPGLTGVHGCDLYWSDALVKSGTAFACTDKGVRAVFDGDEAFVPQAPENGIAHWTGRLKALAELSRGECRRDYGREPDKTYVVGVSNGGYLARKVLERDGGLFDGGVDVSGVHWAAKNNFMTQLPSALKAADAQPPAKAALEAAGLPSDRGSEGILRLYRMIYWEASLALCLGDLDPAYEGPLEEYQLSKRPAEVAERIQAIANTGELKKPLLSLSGKLDCLATLRNHAETYRDSVKAKGGAALHRLYVVDKATHVDKDSEIFPGLDPLMPHAHRAFELLARWVETGQPAPGTLTADAAAPTWGAAAAPVGPTGNPR